MAGRRPDRYAQGNEQPGASGPAGAEAATELYPWEANVESDDNISLSGPPTGNFLLDSTFAFIPDRNASRLQSEEHSVPFLSRPSTIPPIINNFSPFSQELAFNTSVTFSYYSALEVKELSRLAPGDVRYLESKGCLHLPSRPYLDLFIRHYFLHVHPCMPVLDEGQFWDMYSNMCDNREGTDKISLLLFQAMLFAATAVSILP